jgi:hypothetical protein
VESWLSQRWRKPLWACGTKPRHGLPGYRTGPPKCAQSRAKIRTDSIRGKRKSFPMAFPEKARLSNSKDYRPRLCTMCRARALYVSFFVYLFPIIVPRKEAGRHQRKFRGDREPSNNIFEHHTQEACLNRVQGVASDAQHFGDLALSRERSIGSC